MVPSEKNRPSDLSGGHVEFAYYNALRVESKRIIEIRKNIRTMPLKKGRL